MCNGMMLPSLPVSTLYGTIKLFLSADIFKFAVITKQFLLKLIEFIFTKSMLLSSVKGDVDVHCRSTIEVSFLSSHLSNFKTTKPLDLHLHRNI